MTELSYQDFYVQSEHIGCDPSPNAAEKIARYQMYVEQYRHNSVIEEYRKEELDELKRHNKVIEELYRPNAMIKEESGKCLDNKELAKARQYYKDQRDKMEILRYHNDIQSDIQSDARGPFKYDY